MNKSGRVIAYNKPHKPMESSQYYTWLILSKVQDIHLVDTKVKYLQECFGFIVGEDTVSYEALGVLRYIESHYFDTEIAPTLVYRNVEHEIELTHSQLLDLYKHGQYSFEVTPVCHARWSSLDWAKYINTHGFWHGDRSRV